MRYKYVIINSEGLETPILSMEWVSHAELAGANKPLGAGFAQVDMNGVWSAYGESISLKIKSRAEDSQILNDFFGPKKK